MFDISKIFLFFGLIKCLTQTWDYLQSSVELDSSESVYTSYATFDGTIMYTLKKDSLTELYINNSLNGTVEFEGVESFYIIENNIYICPIKSYRPNIYKISNGKLEKLENYPKFIEDKMKNDVSYNWSLKCFMNTYFTNNGIKTIMVFFIGRGFVGYYADKNNLLWPDNNRIFDLNNGKIFYASINFSSKYILKQVYIEENEIKSGIGELSFKTDSDYEMVDYNSIKTLKIFNTKGLKVSNVLIKEFSPSNYEFYLFTYDDNEFQIYKSTSIDYPNNITLDQTPPTFPLDIGESFSVIKFQFFPDSNLYYYLIKGKTSDIQYWGIGDFLLEKILFNSKDQIISIGLYESSLTNFKIMTNNKVYLLCPFELNTNICSLCQNGYSLFLNSKTKNKCIQNTSIDSSFTIINDTYIVCNGLYDETNEKCVSCSNSGEYWILPNNTCNMTCDETLGYSKNEEDKLVLIVYLIVNMYI